MTDDPDDFGALDSILRDDALDDDFTDTGDEFDDASFLAPPVYWPALDADESAEQMEALWPWVEELRLRRFPETLRMPNCWPYHAALVELLQALYDHERASFAPVAPPTAAVGWHLALRDVEARVRDVVSALECGDRDGSHVPPARPGAPEDDPHLRGWLDQLRAAPDQVATTAEEAR